MDIIFYKLQDEVNDVKKKRTLTATQTYTPKIISGYLRGSTSKITPSIEFACDITVFNDWNYCYIADFKRYYFVVDVISVRAGVTAVDLRVDVLTSFLTQSNMNNLRGFVGRCANYSQGNFFIPDVRVQFKSQRNIIVEEPDNITNNIVNITFDINATDNIVISTTNVKDLPPFTDVTIQPELQFLTGTGTIDKDYFRPRGNSYIYVTGIGDTQSSTGTSPIITAERFVWFLNYTGQRSDAESFVNSFMVYPFSIPHDNVYKDVLLVDEIIPVGIPLDALQMRSATKGNSGYLVLKDFLLNRNSIYEGFIDYEPYTKCEIFIPYVGWHTIDLKDNYNCRLMVVYNVDYSSGKGAVFLINKTKNCIIFQSTSQIGIQIPINTTNMRENELKEQNNIRNVFAGMLTSGAMGIVGTATSNPALAVAGITGIGMSIVQFINNENLLIDRATGQKVPTDSTSASISGLKVMLKWSKLVSVNFETSADKQAFISHLGIPTNKVLTLSDVRDNDDYHTYAEIVDLHTTTETGLYSIGDITYNEVRELQDLCSRGVYL